MSDRFKMVNEYYLIDESTGRYLNFEEACELLNNYNSRIDELRGEIMLVEKNLDYKADALMAIDNILEVYKKINGNNLKKEMM